MSRRAIKLITVLLAIATLCAMLTACVRGGGEGGDLEVKLWQEYLPAISDSFIQTFTVDVKEDAYLAAEAEATVGGKVYSVEIKANINFLTSARENIGLIVVKEKESGRTVFSLMNDNEDLYIETYDADIAESVKTKYVNSPLLEVIKLFLDSLNGDLEVSPQGLTTLGKTLFTDCEPCADGRGYSLRFDLRAAMQSKEIKNFLDKTDDRFIAFLYKVLGVDGYDSLIAKMPSVDGTLDLTIEEGVITAFAADAAVGYPDGNSDNFSLDVVKLDFGNGTLQGLADRMPYGDASYLEKKTFTKSVDGKITLYDSAEEEQLITYDYTFNANIDLIDLLYAQADLGQLAEDNFFHLRIFHVCNEYCSSYCSRKYLKGNGSVVDIAFSPQDLGSHNLYISLGVRNLIGIEDLKYLLSGLAFLAENRISDYILITLDTTSLQYGEDKEALPGFDHALITRLMGAIGVFSSADGGITASVDDILSVLNIGGNGAGFIRQVLKSGKFQADSVSVSVDSVKDVIPDYNIYFSTVHIYNENGGATKKYTNTLNQSDPALDWDFNDTVVADGYEYNVIYNDAAANGIFYDGKINISPEELPQLIGSYLKYEYRDIYGNIQSSTVKITSYEGVDESAIGEVQRVRLFTEYPSLFFESSSILLDIKDYLFEYAPVLHEILYGTLEVNIKLSELENVSIDRDDSRKIYYQGEKVDEKSFGDAKAILKYLDGTEKTMSVKASNAGSVFFGDTYGKVISYESSSFTFEYELWGKTYYGDSAEIKPAKSITLKKKKDSITQSLDRELMLSTIKFATALEYVTETNVKNSVYCDASFITVNGNPITENCDIFMLDDNDLVFKYAGNYRLTYAFGDQSVSVDLIITPKEVKPIVSQYSVVDTSEKKEHYFVGYGYEFSGNIVNKVFGEIGSSARIRFRVSKGYTSSSGGLSYAMIDPSAEDAYFTTQSFYFRGELVSDALDHELPPIIYDTLPLELTLKFKVVGYYRITLYCGTSSVNIDVLVEEGQEMAQYELTSDNTRLTVEKGNVLPLDFVLTQLNAGAMLGAQRLLFKYEKDALCDIADNAATESGEAFENVAMPPYTDPIALTVGTVFSETGEYEVEIKLYDSYSFLSSIKFYITVI